MSAVDFGALMASLMRSPGPIAGQSTALLSAAARNEMMTLIPGTTRALGWYQRTYATGFPIGPSIGVPPGNVIGWHHNGSSEGTNTLVLLREAGIGPGGLGGALPSIGFVLFFNGRVQDSFGVVDPNALTNAHLDAINGLLNAISEDAWRDDDLFSLVDLDPMGA